MRPKPNNDPHNINNHSSYKQTSNNRQNVSSPIIYGKENPGNLSTEAALAIGGQSSSPLLSGENSFLQSRIKWQQRCSISVTENERQQPNVTQGTENTNSATNTAYSNKGSQRRRPTTSTQDSTQRGRRNRRGRAHNVVVCGDSQNLQTVLKHSVQPFGEAPSVSQNQGVTSSYQDLPDCNKRCRTNEDFTRHVRQDVGAHTSLPDSDRDTQHPTSVAATAHSNKGSQRRRPARSAPHTTQRQRRNDRDGAHVQAASTNISGPSGEGPSVVPNEGTQYPTSTAATAHSNKGSKRKRPATSALHRTQRHRRNDREDAHVEAACTDIAGPSGGTQCSTR